VSEEDLVQTGRLKAAAEDLVTVGTWRKFRAAAKSEGVIGFIRDVMGVALV